MLKLLLTCFAVCSFLLPHSSAHSQQAKKRTAGGMTFRALDTKGMCPDCSIVQLTGPIEDDTFEAYSEFIATNPLKKNVYFIIDSRGGTMEVAMRLGKMMRDQRIHAIVGRAVIRKGEIEVEPADCASACVFLYVGGVSRSMPDYSRIGIHSWIPIRVLNAESGKTKNPKPQILNQDAVNTIHSKTASYLKYLADMNIDLRIAIPTLQTPYNRIAWIKSRDLSLWNVVTTDSKLSTLADRTWPVIFLPRRVSPIPTNGTNTTEI